MGIFLMIANWLISRRRGYVGREKRASGLNFCRDSETPSWPSVPLIIIGGIVAGIFTPTESAAIAMAYSLF